MYNRVSIFLIFVLSLLAATSISSQSIEAISNAADETIVVVKNLDNTTSESIGIYTEGPIGLHGRSNHFDGYGVRGANASGWGIIGTGQLGGVKGYSHGGQAIHGESHDKEGVYGISFEAIGIKGISTIDFAVYGKSITHHGSYFVGDNEFGYGDIVLGGGSWYGGSDDGVIMSDPTLPGSDIFIVANDAIVLEIGKRSTENGTFEIWNTNDSDKLLTLNESGNMVIKGTLSQGSDINRKHQIRHIDNKEVLEKVVSLPVTEWTYKGEHTRHLGPMAQDFHEAFGLGESETSIAIVDIDGVALASIQALNEIIDQLEKNSVLLENKVSELEKKYQLLQEKLLQEK